MRLLLSITILLLLFISQTSQSQTLQLTKQGAEWTYFQTHDADIDLSLLAPKVWKPVEVPKIFLANPKDGIYLWYKREFSVSTTELNKDKNASLSLYIESIRNADETWLNGIKIGNIGDISPPWDVWQEYPLNLPRVYTIPEGLLKNKNILHIKINTGIGDISGTEYFGSVGITGKVAIQAENTARTLQYKANLKGNNIDVAIIVLGFIDIFLILFLFKSTLHNLPEFRWLLLNSILMISATLILDVYYLNGMKYPIFGFIRYITVFSIPIVTALYFWSQNKNINTKIVIGFVILQTVVALVVLSPWPPAYLNAIAWKITLLLVIVFFLYSLWSSIRNLRNKQVGSLAQFIGLLIYFLSIRTDLFNIDLFEHRNVFIGALIFRYALLWAYFQRIRHMSASYKTLSNRMLSTIEEKRSEMARELHDGLGQHLASSKFQAQLATATDDKKHLTQLTDEIDMAVSSMHRLVKGLHPMALDRHKLQEAIRVESKRLAATYSILINTNLDEQILPKEIEVHLFRIFQEAVSNSVRHGKATKLEVSLKSLSNKLRFTIEDNGSGYKKVNKSLEEKEGGFGLISLQERVNLIGASILQETHPKKGTKLIIEIAL